MELDRVEVGGSDRGHGHALWIVYTTMAWTWRAWWGGHFEGERRTNLPLMESEGWGIRDISSERKERYHCTS